MVLRLKTWESRSPPDPINRSLSSEIPQGHEIGMPKRMTAGPRCAQVHNPNDRTAPQGARGQGANRPGDQGEAARHSPKARRAPQSAPTHTRAPDQPGPSNQRGVEQPGSSSGS